MQCLRFIVGCLFLGLKVFFFHLNLGRSCIKLYLGSILAGFPLASSATSVPDPQTHRRRRWLDHKASPLRPPTFHPTTSRPIHMESRLPHLKLALPIPVGTVIFMFNLRIVLRAPSKGAVPIATRLMISIFSSLFQLLAMLVQLYDLFLRRPITAYLQ